MSIWLQRAAIAATLLFAIFVRGDALSESNYWYDEAITALRVAGHTEMEVWTYGESRTAFPIGELKQFVQVTGATTTKDTVQSLAVEDSQHTPFYYVLARWWCLAFGSSIAAGRALAVVFSVLALAAMYWLCLELFVLTGAFESRLVCWAGVLLLAISPYQVAIGREHREYSMWALTTLCVCAALLRAMRLNQVSAWALYALAVIVSVYTHLFTILMLAFLGVFLLARERFRPSRTVLSFAAASLAAAAACTPWFLILLSRQKTAESSLGWVQDFTKGRFNLAISIKPALEVANYSLWDSQKLLTDVVGFKITTALFHLLPVALLFGIWWFARGQRKACAWFAAAMICSVSGTLFALDMVTGGISGFAYRYAGPSNIGWLLALTLIITAAVADAELPRGLVQAAVCVVVALSATSAVMTHSAKHTFLKFWEPQPAILSHLNANTQASLVSDDFVGAMIALGHEVRDGIPLTWHPRCYACPRVVIPQLDIPFPGSAGMQSLYFRTWINTPSTGLQALADSMMVDQLGDPRFHSEVVKLETLQENLFLLTPR